MGHEIDKQNRIVRGKNWYQQDFTGQNSGLKIYTWKKRYSCRSHCDTMIKKAAFIGKYF